MKKYNVYALKAIKERYGFSTDYIRKSLRGDRTSIMSKKIIEEYKIMEKRIDTVIKVYINK